ncbi:right-handed parallel beta-helix repeat-containing protein [Mesorhizobium sp. CN2-181]|uniref:right-handed parallel beta-helix repeat-containing protein n=1 Tax=Mesorhizobium yinganensis TaxID=3157707 RepID=UPI0032B73925
MSGVDLRPDRSTLRRRWRSLAIIAAASTAIVFVTLAVPDIYHSIARRAEEPMQIPAALAQPTVVAGAPGGPASPASRSEPIPAGFPDESTTGVPDETLLTPYTGPMRITQNETVIENKIIVGSLWIRADNVVLRNCRLNYTAWWGIDAEGAKNITVENCEIVGPGYGGDSNAAILGSGNFLRNNISRSENGIVLQGGASLVKGNYIHNLEDKSADPHYDGISVQGGQDGVLIEGNTVIARDTSNIFIKNDFGPISNVTVNNNYLAGTPGINIYVDGRASGGPIVGVSITNNHLVKGGYGYYSVDNSTPTISGNIELPGETLITQPDPATPAQP